MTTDSSKALPKTFNDAGLYPPIVAVLKSMKISVPTKIQAEILGPARAGLDIIAISATGSGKTIAYLLPLFEMLKRDEKTRGLILTPTRETADQILKVLEPFADELGLSLSLVIGGRSAAKQENELKSRARIVVATPGRLNDHLLNNKLLLQET
ncbi:MAG: DEAD/DEAH box helicase, partial [Bdellovibrionales bacterium]|nr:DEAD/DEAH box helicase [Bdellovibrionales bacterium]